MDFESIEQGPFYLKDSGNITIKYIRDDFLKLVRTDVNGENIVDSIKKIIIRLLLFGRFFY
ncbi:TPA: hypothetical protein ACIVXL_004517, partial [Salmonella enterica subsp. houtenae serovar 1,40:z4,z23:-]